MELITWAMCVCAIEVVSPGNKAGKIAIREFVTKAVDFLRRGINLLVVDPFPPGVQDPQTLHKLIWDEFDAGVPFALPADEPLLLASYRAAVPLVELTPEAFTWTFTRRPRSGRCGSANGENRSTIGGSLNHRFC